MAGRGQRRSTAAGALMLGAVLVGCTSTSANDGEAATTLSVPPLAPATTGPVPTADDVALVTSLLSALYGVFHSGDYGAAVIGLDPALVTACGGPEGLRALQQVVRDREGRAWRLDGVEAAERTATGIRVRVRASAISVGGDLVLRGEQGGIVELRPQFGAPYGWVVANELVPLGVAPSCGRVPGDGPVGGEPTEVSGPGATAPLEEVVPEEVPPEDAPPGEDTAPGEEPTTTTTEPEPPPTEPPAPEPPPAEPEPTTAPAPTEPAPGG